MRVLFRSHAGRLLVAFEDVPEARLLERHKDILAAELSHRIKNSLQIIASFVHFELRDAPEPCIEGYQSMETRISAIAQLYDLISRSAAFGPVQRSEERRVGKECCSTCSSRWSPYH